MRVWTISHLTSTARRLALGLGVLLGGVVLSGCGRSDRIPLQPVRGQVFYDGKPVPHAHVVLHPVEPAGQDAPRPQAQVGADGSFAVSTYEAGDGAPTGEYAVTVQWLLTSARNQEAPPQNQLPVRYGLASTSGLRLQVRQGEIELPPLHLKK